MYKPIASFEGKGVKATLYRRSQIFGNVVKTSVWLREYGTDTYAQYSSDPYVVFVQKGKRKVVRYRGSGDPYCLIVEGWDTPGGPDFFRWQNDKSQISPFVCFDEEWTREFEDIIEPQIRTGAVKVIHDFRPAGLV